MINQKYFDFFLKIWRALLIGKGYRTNHAWKKLPYFHQYCNKFKLIGSKSHALMQISQKISNYPKENDPQYILQWKNVKNIQVWILEEKSRKWHIFEPTNLIRGSSYIHILICTIILSTIWVYLWNTTWLYIKNT